MLRLLTISLCILTAFSAAAEDERAAALDVLRLESYSERPLRPYVLHTFARDQLYVSGTFADSMYLLTVVSGDATIDLDFRLTQGVRVIDDANTQMTTWTSGDVTVRGGSCKNKAFMVEGLVVLGAFSSILPELDSRRNNLDHVELIIAKLNRSNALQGFIKRNCPERIVSTNFAPFAYAREKYLV